MNDEFKATIKRKMKESRDELAKRSREFAFRELEHKYPNIREMSEKELMEVARVEDRRTDAGSWPTGQTNHGDWDQGGLTVCSTVG
jgi:hypothetical protein